MQNLLRSYQSGDKTAWDALCLKYGPRLAQFFYNREIENPEDVQDLVQDTLLTAMEVIHKIRKPESFNFFLFTIANRKKARWFEEKEIHESYVPSEDEFTETVVESTPAYLEPEHIAIRTEYLTIVHRLMKQLSQNQRLALLLNAKGMKQKEIADTLGTTTNNVKVLVKRGREKLKALLKAKYPDDFADMIGIEVLQSLIGNKRDL